MITIFENSKNIQDIDIDNKFDCNVGTGSGAHPTKQPDSYPSLNSDQIHKPPRSKRIRTRNPDSNRIESLIYSNHIELYISTHSLTTLSLSVLYVCVWHG